MPNNEDDGPHAQNGEGHVLRNFVLLALPWLSFQREMLAIMKKGIEDASHVRPIENLTARELQALMMILDPSGKRRSLLDRDLEKKIEETYAKAFPKLASGSIFFIDAQETLLASISDLLDKLRKGTKSNAYTSRKTTD
jgi:hypothetical protein